MPQSQNISAAYRGITPLTSAYYRSQRIWPVGDAPPPGPADAETADLLAAGYTAQEAADIIEARYSTTAVVPRPNAAALAALVTGVGATFRWPPYQYLAKVMDTSINQINAERQHENADGTLLFWRRGSVWQLFDAVTLDKVGSTMNLAYNGISPTDAVRWHPTDPDILFFPIGNQIIFYNVQSRNHSVFATSPHGTLGTGNRRLAGGDGNDDVYNPITGGGYMLVSHGGNNTGCQVINLLTGNVVTSVWNGTAYVFQEVAWDADSPTFDLPAGTLFDYATLSLAHPVTGEQYIVSSADGNGTTLHDFSGRLIGQVYPNANHMHQNLVEVGDALYLGLGMKVTAGLVGSTSGNSAGDGVSVYYSVAVDGSGNYSLTVQDRLSYDWLGSGPAGGGQHSSYSPETQCALIANNPPEYVNVTGWDVYYGEVIEISMDDDDPAVRRGPHHMIGDFNVVGDQPEAWLNKAGTIAFIKSDIMGQLSQQHLFGIFLPPRNAPENR